MCMNIENIIKKIRCSSNDWTAELFNRGISNICGIKKSNSKIIENNCNIKTCSCGCIMSKNGHTKTGVQKYKCPGCSKKRASRKRT